jgi:hypothetical protein
VKGCVLVYPLRVMRVDSRSPGLVLWCGLFVCSVTQHHMFKLIEGLDEEQTK